MVHKHWFASQSLENLLKHITGSYSQSFWSSKKQSLKTGPEYALGNITPIVTVYGVVGYGSILGEPLA